MIRYTLACDAGHRFESWFGDSAAFDALAGEGLITCLVCGSPHVVKAIMAPAVRASHPAANRPARTDPPRAALPHAVSPRQAAGSAEDPSGDGASELRGLIRALRSKVLSETQDVGGRFPEEARRMHEGDIPHRDIRGEATLDEARALLEDGVLILPVPGASDELN